MLSIGKKKYRNIQEQVGYNTEQIETIFQIIDGLNIQDNVVIVPDMSYILSEEELKIVNKEVAFIVYDNQLYIKKSQDASTAYFDIVFTISGSSTVISFSSKEIQVTLSNGALGNVVSTASTYNQTQIDSLLSSKASITYVDSQLASGLAQKANLSGANFTGSITAPSIIENMTGYSYVKVSSTEDHTIDYVYCSAVKNGNKLTLVWFFDLQYITGGGEFSVGRFSLPSDVMNKIYPIPFSGNTAVVDFKSVQALSAVNQATSLNVSVRKYSNGITLFVMNANTLTPNTHYMVRVEETFLLSDNLAQ